MTLLSKKKLIVNADDFGQSDGINKGIIQAHEKGIVTSASLMVRYPAAAYAAKYSKSKCDLGVGLHLDLGEWIYNDGNWDSLYEVVSLDDVQTVTKEINNQIEAFYNIMGRKPTHIDSHQHVHLRKSICPIIIDIARELNVTLRLCSDTVNYCGDFYGQLIDGSAFHEAISEGGLRRTLSKLNSGITELACHPGLYEDIETMYSNEREREVETLCKESIQEVIANCNIELCTFDGIPFKFNYNQHEIK